MNASKQNSTFRRDVLLCVVLAGISTGIGWFVVRDRAEPPAMPAAHGAPVSPESNTASMISLGGFHRLVEEKRGILLDTRADWLYRKGHVPGALSLSAIRFQACYAKLKSRLEADKSQPLVLYCDGVQCGASEQVATRLLALGYTRVSVFKEGWMVWKEAGMPQEKSEGADVALAPWKAGKS